MTAHTESGQMTSAGALAPLSVNARIKIAALWTALLFVFAYVDLFSLYRPDVRADIAAGQIGGFTIDQTFLLLTTVYVAIPSLMVFGAVVLRPTLNRVLNILLSAAYGITIVGGAIGQWNYYLVGSAVEVVLLASIVYYAVTWPRLGSVTSASATAELSHPVATASA